MKAVVAAFNQEKAIVGAFSVITNLRMEFFDALEQSGAERQGPAVASGHGLIVQQHHQAWAAAGPCTITGDRSNILYPSYTAAAAPAANIFHPVQIFSSGAGWTLDGGYLDEIMLGHDWSCSRPG